MKPRCALCDRPMLSTMRQEGAFPGRGEVFLVREYDAEGLMVETLVEALA